ncbi:hypothetical protein C0991_004501 [Blastosporella zonata]|nr:hypothetical protein C0991_004501 [Blastosporella zonata]
MSSAPFLLISILSQCWSTFSTPILQSNPAQTVYELRPTPEFKSSASLPVPNSTHSFWIDTPGANPLAREGSESELTPEADVCIIGSGITGVSAAYHLAKTLATREGGQVKAVVLDARDFCSGATGRNGGHLTPVHFNHFAEKEQVYGREQAKKAFALEHYTTSELARITKEEKWEHDVDLVSSEHLGLLVTEKEVERAKLDFAAAHAAGVDLSAVDWLSDDEVRVASRKQRLASKTGHPPLYPRPVAQSLKVQPHIAHQHACNLYPALLRLPLMDALHAPRLHRVLIRPPRNERLRKPPPSAPGWA